MKKLALVVLCLALILAPGCVVAGKPVGKMRNGEVITVANDVYMLGCNPSSTSICGEATAIINFVCLSPLGLAIGMPLWIGGYATYNSLGSENDSYTGEVDSK